MSPEPTKDNCPSPSTCHETVTCDNLCRATSVVITGVCGPITCSANAPAAQSCPITCGYQGGTVPDGRCSTITCAPTQACVVDVCPNIAGVQSTLPDGYHFETNNDEVRVCVKDVVPPPTSSPTPVPTPTPTSTPNPSSGRQSKTAISDPVCEGNNFDAKIQLMLDGNPASGINVKFVYNGEAKYAKTGTDGWAGVAYGFVSGKDEVDFYPEDGYPTQIQHVIQSASCKKPAVLGISTQDPPVRGKVLGATTMAKAGAFEDALMNMVGWMGAGLTTVGSLLYAKKKN